MKPVKIGNIRKNTVALKIAGIYGVIGVLWIFFSDELAVLLSPSSEILTRVSMAKGWAYVLVTAFLLYFLVRSSLGTIERSEDALRLSQEKYRSLVQGAGSIILQLDHEGTIVFANDFACDFFGYDCETLIGRPFRGTVVPASNGSGTEPGCMTEGVLAHPEQTLCMQTECLRTDGRRVRVAWTSKAVPGVRNGETEILCIGNDISQSKEMEDRLRESEQRLSLILDSANDGYFDWNVATGEAWLSPRYYTMLGYEPGEFPANIESFIKLLHPESAEQLDRMTQQLMRSEENRFDAEYLMEKKTGEWVWVHSRGRIVERDAEGNTTRFVGVHVDITESKKAEETLKRFELLATHSRDIMFFVEADTGKILEANHAAAQAYGYSHEELLSLNISDLRTPDSLGPLPDQLAEADELGVLFETMHRRKDGSVFPVEVNSRGAIIGGVHILSSVVRNISRRKAADAALRRWADAFMHCAHGIALGSPETEKIVICNPAFARLLGRSVEEVNGSHVLSTYHPEEHAAVARFIEEANRTGFARFESRVLLPDGNVVPVQIDLVGVKDENGNLLYRVATVQDITERKIAMDALRDSLEEKVALLNEVHHRVKNNLQVVMSLLSLQETHTSNPAAAAVLQDIRHRVHSMSLLHETLYRSGNLARINFAAYTEELCRRLHLSFGARAMRIRLVNRVEKIGIPLEQSVPCGLIINELLSNALKHAFPDGREGQVEVDLGFREEGILALCVRDDGAGLPPGFDVEGRSTLGLRLVARLASQLGGRLTVDRSGSAGTSFCVVFPAPENLRMEMEKES